ncbi:MAG: ATP-dependent Clp protease ATP-binding subunit [Clostridia bacterium]|mgnify:FL=1|nr:ATP-dependent Clp protease ATP-binding subunit [Clostridia bacterium]MDY3785817.1 ATP-dependent Clp protease ATP-binding subunit [Eubacteriales bacterium]
MYSTKKTRYCDDELNNEYSPLSEIVDRYEDDGVEDSEENGGADESKDKDGKNELLKKYCVSLTGKARKGQIDEVVGREREVERIIQILSRRQKNNPCLIGEPGVGKTAIAEALATRIVNHKVPIKLLDKEIYLLDIAGLVAGTQFRGQFEERIKNIINEIKSRGNIILLIDEIHSIVGAGDADGSLDAATIFKPALARGEIQIIGTTTLKDYRKYIEKDSALERRFQPVMVEEPSKAEAIQIICGIKKYYEDFHGVRIPDDIVEYAVDLSERYINERFLPDKAIDLIDEAAAHVSITNPILVGKSELTAALSLIDNDIEQFEAVNAKQSNPSERCYDRIALLKTKEKQLSLRLDEYKKLGENVNVTGDDLADVVEIWTGIPARNVSKSDFERINGLEARLASRVIGQKEATEAVAKAIKRSRARISPKRKPVSFIFAGPTGVGKTELVKTLAGDLFDTPDALIRIDMSEYMEKFAVSRIIGAPPGYVGHDESGQLTEKVRRRPYSVILFDEIEKAHPDVMNVLLQILDDGRITDATGVTVNFENTIIVMTTNAGSSEKVASDVGFGGSGSSNHASKTRKALEQFLRPEFINRVDEIIIFNSLTKENFVDIAKLMLSDLKKVLAERNIDFEYGEEAAEFIANESYSPVYGARNMRRYIQKNVEDELAEELLSDYRHKFSKAVLGFDNGKLSAVCS